MLQHLIVVKVLFQHITVVDKHERAHEAKRQKIARMSQFMNEPKPDQTFPHWIMNHINFQSL